MGTITVCGASDFSHFFNMAACPNHTTTSSYRCIVGLMKRSPVIPTQTLSLHNSKWQMANTASMTFIGFAIIPIFLTRQHTDTIQEHHATVI